MKQELLVQMGLTKSQAGAYLELVKAGSLTPPQLAKRTGESRTASYMSLAKLVDINLAREVEDAKKQTYLPASPSALYEFLAKKRRELSEVESNFRDTLPVMLSYYYSYRGRPGVRFYEGEDGLEKIYEDHLRTREPIAIVRTPADEKYFGSVLDNYMQKRAKLKIPADLLGPGVEGAVQWARENDERLNRTTHWCPPDAYTAPVEVSIYGNKVSMISFGDEDVGTIIESPQIAEAMRQLYEMAKVGAAQLMKDKAV